jgi:hypothetical protein
MACHPNMFLQVCGPAFIAQHTVRCREALLSYHVQLLLTVVAACMLMLAADVATGSTGCWLPDAGVGAWLVHADVACCCCC